MGTVLRFTKRPVGRAKREFSRISALELRARVRGFSYWFTVASWWIKSRLR